MEDIAVQLFKLGDQESKGFIVKRDMQRLRGEVSLPPDQLEAVFESLDSSRNGYLTLDQFLEGVNNLNGHEGRGNAIGEEQDHSIQQLLNLNVLHKSGELMCEVRQLVSGSSEASWHQLLAALFSDLNQLLRQIAQLEDTLRTRDTRHHQEIQRLYDELECQLEDQSSRLTKQAQAREAEMRGELVAKEQQIQELLSERDELQQRLAEGERQMVGEEDSPAWTRATDCLSDATPTPQESEEEPVGVSVRESVLAEQRRRRLERAIAESYDEGYRHARHRATIEEEGLIKQLHMLQEMQETLRSGMTTVAEKPPRISYDDM